MFLKSDWCRNNIVNVSEVEAYGLSKVASLGTSAVVGGLVVGNAMGILGAVLMWIAAEVVTFALRILCGWISSFFTADGSDYFDR